jgi:histidinol-phosphatase (PHP family)
MLFDSHMHTPLCHHATGAPLEYAFEAAQAGLAGICFTEHMPLPHDADAHLRLRWDELTTYREMILHAKTQHTLEVRCGLEMDFMPNIEAFSRQLLKQFEWDYIIGSVHRVDELGYGIAPHPERLESYWRRYYELVALAAGSGLYDSIGHLDLPKRWVAPPPNHLELLLPALDAIADAGLALDFNTSGWRIAGEPHPTLEILRHAFQRKIPLVLGSDAHAPEHVGWQFADAVALAKQAGYSHVGAVKQRKLETFGI